MPIIEVKNHKFADETRALATALRDACLGVQELGLARENQVTVVFGGRQIIGEEDQRVLVDVRLLFETPERTKGVRNRLARDLYDAVKKILGNERLVEVVISRFDQTVDSFILD